MNDPILQYKYATLIGDRLDGFKKLRNGIYNFRCPICGDSEKNHIKKRGYLLEKNGEYWFYCHNCGTSMSLKQFIQHVDSELYKEYQTEIMTSGRLRFDKKEPVIKVPKFELKKSNHLIPLSKLDRAHPAVQYLNYRNVSESCYQYVKWCDNFPELVNETIGDKYKDSWLPECGIVFELREFDGKITGYQIRSIEKDCPKTRRFVICSINDEHGFYYKNIDYNRRIYIVEGCIDSLFIENCIAVLSASLYRIHPSDNCVYVNDQEPRNQQVVKQIGKCIEKGYRVVLMPHEYEGMDINDMINSGVKPDELKELFDKYTYSGLSAKIQFSKWKK